VINGRLLLKASDLSLKAYSGIPKEPRFPIAMEFHTAWTATTAFLFIEDHMQHLVWPGTADFMDFLLDASALPPVPYGTGLCHPGFAIAHKSIWYKVAPHIRRGIPLGIYGHSLGGGLAEKSADFTRDHDAPVHGIFFGKPNTHCRWKLPDLSYMKTRISVVAGSDIVTRVPRYLYAPCPGQQKLYLANDGNSYFNPEPSFIRSDWKLLEAFEDHSMIMYHERIKEILGGKADEKEHADVVIDLPAGPDRGVRV
jgi:hypothetical protein